MQQQMMQQQMQQQMMQQQMMQQQMMQLQMLQQQIMQQQMMEQQMMNEKYFNIKFKKMNGEINKINIKGNKRIKDLFDKYITDIYGSFTFKKLAFLYNGAAIDRDDQRKVEDCFKNKEGCTVLVVESSEYI